ncbi:MAG: hypothetical protein ABIR81_01435 [Ginsengibacter sp.]
MFRLTRTAINEIISTFVTNTDFKPYGKGLSGNAPIIALGEGWAYYIGHFYADRTYGINSSCQREQKGGGLWCTADGTGHPHLDVEENFNPNLTVDNFEWIPQGLFHDLRDPTGETAPVLDQVAGYTHAQLFNTFQSNIYNLQNYRLRLLQTTTNTTSSQVTALFSQYNY